MHTYESIQLSTVKFQAQKKANLLGWLFRLFVRDLDSLVNLTVNYPTLRSFGSNNLGSFVESHYPWMVGFNLLRLFYAPLSWLVSNFVAWLWLFVRVYPRAIV